MTREKIEAQIQQARTEIAVAEFQLTLPKDQREGKKDGTTLHAERQRAKKRVKDLEKWLESGFFYGGGGGGSDSSRSRLEVIR
jgi:hypothetical protein